MILTESERARLLEVTHDAILVRDLDGTIRYWNRGAEEVYGWTASDAIGQRSHALLSTVFPGSLDRIEAALLDTGRWDGELRHVRADGRAVVVESRWVLVEEGGHRQVLELNTDITARKQSEDQVRVLEARTAAALRNAALILFTQDCNLRYTWARNVRLGLDEASLLGAGDDILDRVTSEELIAFKREVLRTGVGARRVVRASHGDHVGWFDVSVEPLRDASGAVVGLTGSAFDVTELRLLQQEALDEQRRLRLALTAARLGVFEFDLATGRVTWSPECYRIFGVETFDGTVDGVLALVHPDDRERMASPPPVSGVDGEPVRLEFRIVRPNGDVRWVFNLVESFLDEAGRLVKQVGVVGDITEHRQHQEAVRVLTSREREVLRLIADGKSSKEIGVTLGISGKTAETHRTNLMRKLDIHSVGALVRVAVRSRLVEP